MNMTLDDTIAAISTPVGEGAIAVLRVSGSEAKAIVGRIFRCRTSIAKWETRRLYLGQVVDEDGKIDQVVGTYFRAPHSYTGQDLVEISCHGGILVTRQILALLLRDGARSAEPGEFTQRAFLNGKMDLTQAEAVMDVIRAQTELALRAANEQLAGGLGSELAQIQDALLTTLAHVEAYIDFPDEQIDPDTGASLSERLKDTIRRLGRLLSTAEQGRILRHGLRTVIYGEPNVGKSSLLNLLLGYDRAIVSEIAGTTRDTIEDTINFHGIPVRLVDTAGARESRDRLEQEGIRRTQKEIEQADLVLEVVDASQPRKADVQPDKKRLLILNKVDLGLHPDWKPINGIRFSCKTDFGREALENEIQNRVLGGELSLQNSHIAINARHQACLRQAERAVAQAIEGIAENRLPELIAIDLRSSLDAVGEVIGKHDTEDLLGKIFSEFCIGK
jgi:tRNA modification GTPase